MSYTKKKQQITIFFSHSTIDHKIVVGIKDLISKHIPTINKIFVSSDGQSIRYGKNWLSEIEKALNTCDIMFAFVSNSSIASPWLHYEIGYVSARKKPVVPICINGFEISALPFPIKMNHGFEFNSPDSLNKIVLLLKEHLNIQSNKVFGKRDYNFLSKKLLKRKSFAFCKHAHLIERIEVCMEKQDPFPVEKYQDAFTSINLQTRVNRIGDESRNLFEIDTFGIKFIKDDYFSSMTFECIADQIGTLSKIISQMKKNALMNDNLKQIQLSFNSAINKDRDKLQFSAKIEKTKINLSDNYQLEYQGIVFVIAHNPFSNRTRQIEINIYKLEDISDFKKLGKLIDYLFEKEILYP